MSEPGGGGGGGEDGSAGLEVSAVQNVADVSVLQKHLRKLVPLLLEDGGEAPAALEAALEEKSALEQMRKFLSDPQVHTVLVERSTLKGAGAGAGRRPAGLAPLAVRGPPGLASPRDNGPALSARASQDGRAGWRQRRPAGPGGGRIPASVSRFRFGPAAALTRSPASPHPPHPPRRPVPRRAAPGRLSRGRPGCVTRGRAPRCRWRPRGVGAGVLPGRGTCAGAGLPARVPGRAGGCGSRGASPARRALRVR